MISKQILDKLKSDFEAKLDSAKDSEKMEELRIEFLGRKAGKVTELFAQIPGLGLKEKKTLVPLLTALKKDFETKLQNKKFPVKTPQLTSRIQSEDKILDLTIPGTRPQYGHEHPTIKIINEIKEIFHYLGFLWTDGPEVEFDLYNFQKLRIPKNHPARDLQQTYYIDEEILLRTQTSTMQIRYLEQNQPPVRMLFPGRVYRVEQVDATHLPAFYQVEGLLVDQGVRLTDLLGVLDFFAKKMFGQKTRTRVYGHHFPYTEPSIEVEVLHKSGKWLEIMGAGMVHPEVLKNCGIDPKKFTGFAFGMGPERIAMLKHGIDDIRLFYSNDLRFLEQF